MLLDPQPLETDQALLQLGKRLWADGYRFTCVSPATHARVIARHAGEPASTLRDIFGWSRPFAPALICADELEPLQRAQVLTAHTQLLRSNVRWSNYEDLLLVHSAYPTAASDAVFFGPDSYRFAQVILAYSQRTPQPVEHANPPYMLDVGERTYRHGGGALGAELSLRIVEQACERLTIGGSLLLYTGVAIVEGRDALLDAIRLRLAGPQWAWVYREIDPDVFGEQLSEPGYQQVERIAAVALTVTRSR